MTSYQPYYCEHCRSRYLWSQERITPGFCSSKCQADDAARKSQVPFEVQLLAKIMDSVPAGVKVGDVVEQYREQKASDLAQVKEQRCECCDITSYRGRPLKFVMYHQDGNPDNNAPNNLKMLCPNCASQELH